MTAGTGSGAVPRRIARTLSLRLRWRLPPALSDGEGSGEGCRIQPGRGARLQLGCGAVRLTGYLNVGVPDAG